jgi:hypothetical protein
MEFHDRGYAMKTKYIATGTAICKPFIVPTEGSVQLDCCIL